MNVLMKTVVVLVLQTDCKVKFLQEQKSEGAQHVFASTSSHGEGRARKSRFLKCKSTDLSDAASTTTTQLTAIIMSQSDEGE